jgi:transposase
MGATARRWKISDELWAKMEPLLPEVVNTHPRGGGRKRVPYRKVMNGILFVLRTGCQWKALDATGICSGSTAHARFQEWERAGMFVEFWKQGLLEYDEMHGLDWNWQAMDGAMTKAPLGGGKKREEPHRPRKTRREAVDFV